MSQATSFTVKQTVSVTAGASSSEAFEYRGFNQGEVYIPAGSTLSSALTWWAAEDPDGTFYAAQDGAGSAITSTPAASKSIPIPSELRGAGALKIVATPVESGDVIVSLKG